MKKFRLITIVIGIALLMSGCSSQKSWVYRPNNYDVKSVKSEKTVAIKSFEDLRENININNLFFYYLPVFPFGWQNLDVPEGQANHTNSGLWTNYNPKEDFAKALAQELEGANIFKEAYFSFQKGKSNLLITGKILNTKYKGKTLSYGITTFACVYLWFLGAPCTVVSNELSIKLICLDSETEEVLFSKTYTAPKYKKTSWIYVMKTDFYYSEMLKGIYKEFIVDLKNNVIRK